MNGFIITTLAICGLYSGLFAAPARAEWVRYQDYKVKIDAPKDWKTETDLYGIPVTALGPDRGGERAVVLIQHTELSDVVFAKTDLADRQKEYIKARKEWLEKTEDSVFKSALPPVFHSKTNGITGYEFAYRYHLREHEFEEHSAQISCHGKLYLIKTLSSEKNTKQDLKALGNILDHFECSSVTQKDGPYVPGPLHQIQDALKEYRASEWPGIEDYKKASASEKGQSLEALVEFYKRYDEASIPEDEDFSSAPSKANRLFQNFVQHLNHLFPEASADDAYNCFFGGWPSKLIPKSGHLTCDYPENQNDEYKKLQSACGEGEMLCNPALFGQGQCVGTQNASLRRHATLECELKLTSSGKTFADVTQEKDYDNKLLNETIESAKKVCNSTEYLSSNYGLCSTLEQKLNLSIAASKHQKVKGDEDFSTQLAHMKPDLLEAKLKEVEAGWGPFQKKCINEKGDINPTIPECADLAQKFISDFETIEKAKAIAQDEANPNKVDPNKTCTTGNCDGKTTEPVPAPQGSCTTDEKERMKNRPCDWTSPFSCTGKIITSTLHDLWDSVTGVGELAVAGAKGVGHLAKAGYNEVKHLIGFGDVDGQMANKAHQVSQTGDSLLTSLKERPLDTAKAIAQSLVDQAVSFLDNNAFCQHWSDWKHTKCDLPANRTCISCLDRINGYCSVVGYIVGEALPFIISGGSSALASRSGTILKMGEFLSQSSRSAKMVKLLAEVQTKLPTLAKMREGLGIAEKASAVMKAARQIELIDKSLSALEKFTKTFKTLYGTLEQSIVALRQKSKVINGSAWLAGKVGTGAVKTAGFVLGIPSVPYSLVDKGVFKIAEKGLDRMTLKTIEKETLREVASREAGSVAEYVSPITRTMPDATAKVATKTQAFAKDLEDVDGVKVKNSWYKPWRKGSYEKTVAKQEKILEKVEVVSTPETFGALSPEDRLAEIKKTQKYGYFTERKLNKNAEKIESGVHSAKSKIELPSRAKVDSPDITLFKRLLITAPVPKYLLAAGKVKEDAKQKINVGVNDKDLEELAKERGVTKEVVKAQVIKDKQTLGTLEEVRNRWLSDQPHTAEDKAILAKENYTEAKLQGIVNTINARAIAQKIALQETPTPDDEIHRAAIGLTYQQIIDKLTDDPEALFK